MALPTSLASNFASSTVALTVFLFVACSADPGESQAELGACPDCGTLSADPSRCSPRRPAILLQVRSETRNDRNTSEPAAGDAHNGTNYEGIPDGIEPVPVFLPLMPPATWQAATIYPIKPVWKHMEPAHEANHTRKFL
mmetsp:Transcript_97962/g.179017  ORF Transcript_97962/g.179017 Transcript_97962/m.179017 type:complete len:139 (+) Transcript_97962:74-490(+)